MAGIANVQSDMSKTISQFEQLNRTFEKQSRAAELLASRMSALGSTYDVAAAKSRIGDKQTASTAGLQAQLQGMRALASQYDATTVKVKTYQEELKRLSRTQQDQRYTLQSEVRSGAYKADRNVSRVDRTAYRAEFDARNQYKYDKIDNSARSQVHAVELAKNFNIARSETAAINKLLMLDAVKEAKTLQASVNLEQQLARIRSSEADSVARTNRQLEMQLDSLRTMTTLRAKLRANEVKFKLDEFARTQPKGSDEYKSYAQKLKRRQKFEDSQDAVRLATATEQQQLRAAATVQEREISASNAVRDAKIKTDNAVVALRTANNNKAAQLEATLTQKTEQLKASAEARKTAIEEAAITRTSNLRVTLEAQASAKILSEEERRAKREDRLNADVAKNRLRFHQQASRDLLNQQLADAKQAAEGAYNSYKQSVQKNKTQNSSESNKELAELKKQIDAVGTLKRLKDNELRVQRDIVKATRSTTQVQKQGTADVLAGHLHSQKQQLESIRGLATAHKNASQQAIEYWKFAVANQLMATFRRVLSYIYTSVASSIARAREAQVWVARIQTISQTEGVSSTEWMQRALQVSNRYGADLANVLSATYTTVSDQVAKGVSAVNLLNSAIKLSITGVSTLDEALMTQNATLNSYQLSIAEAENVNAVWFKTLELGRLKLEETSNEVGRFAPIAYQLGLSYEEVNAQLAALTIQGMKFQVASTLTRNIMLKLVKPTKEMTELFKEWGVTSGEAAVQAFGFSGVLERIFEAAKGGGSRALGELAGEIRSITGYTALLSDSGRRYRAYLAQMTDAQDQYARATEIMLDTTAQKWKEQLNEAQNYFTQNFGQSVLDFFGLFESKGYNLADILENKVIPAIKAMLSLLAANTIVRGFNSLATLTSGAFTPSLATTDATKAISSSQANIAALTAQSQLRQQQINQMTQQISLGQSLSEVDLKRLGVLQTQQVTGQVMIGQEATKLTTAKAILANEKAIASAKRAQLVANIKMIVMTIAVSYFLSKAFESIQKQAEAVEYLRQLELDRRTQLARQSTELEIQTKRLQEMRLEATKFRQSWNTLVLGNIGQARRLADSLEEDFKKSFKSVESYLETIFKSLDKHLDKLKSRIVESFKYTQNLNQDSNYFSFERMYAAIGDLNEEWTTARNSVIGYYEAVTSGQRSASDDIVLAGRRLQFLSSWLQRVTVEQEGFYAKAAAGDDYALAQARKLNDQILARADTLHQLGYNDDEISQYEVAQKARINTFEAQLRQQAAAERQSLQAMRDREMQQFKQLQADRDNALKELKDTTGLDEEQRRKRRQEVATNYAQRLNLLIQTSQQITDYLMRQEQVYSFDSSMQAQTSELIDTLRESSDGVTKPLNEIENLFRDYVNAQQTAQDFEELRRIFDDLKTSLNEFQQATKVATLQVVKQSSENMSEGLGKVDIKNLGKDLFYWSSPKPGTTAVVAEQGVPGMPASQQSPDVTHLSPTDMQAIYRLMGSELVQTFSAGAKIQSDLSHNVLNRAGLMSQIGSAFNPMAIPLSRTLGKRGGATQVDRSVFGSYFDTPRLSGIQSQLSGSGNTSYQVEREAIAFEPRLLAERIESTLVDIATNAASMSAAEIMAAKEQVDAGLRFLSGERERLANERASGTLDSNLSLAQAAYLDYLNKITPALTQAAADAKNIAEARAREDFSLRIRPSAKLNADERERENMQTMSQMEALGFDEKDILQFTQMAEAMDAGLVLQTRMADSGDQTVELLRQQLDLLTTTDPEQRRVKQAEYQRINKESEARRGYEEIVAEAYRARPTAWKEYDQSVLDTERLRAEQAQLRDKMSNPLNYMRDVGGRMVLRADASTDRQRMLDLKNELQIRDAQNMQRGMYDRGLLGYKPFDYVIPEGQKQLPQYPVVDPGAIYDITSQAVRAMQDAQDNDMWNNILNTANKFNTLRTAPAVKPAPTTNNPAADVPQPASPDETLTINTTLNIDGERLARHVETVSRRNRANGFVGRTLKA